MKCRNLVESRSRVVAGYGSVPARIMFVGLAPGRNGADLTGVPFTRDPSGLLFQKALIDAGLSLESDPGVSRPRLRDAYVTNLVKCNPRDCRGNNRPPSRQETNACFSHLVEERLVVRPKVVVTLGRMVTEKLLGRPIGNLTEICGEPIQIGGIFYIPMIHPSYVIRGAYGRLKFINKFRKICQFSASLG